MGVRRTLATVWTAIVSVIVITTCQEDGDVRLRDGHSAAEGRVEVYYQGQWGTICDDGFDLTDANIICRQLGYSSANASHCCAHFTHGSGPILMDDLACTGTETRLNQCAHRGWSDHNCAHTEDASVTCNGKIRLAGANSTIQGRVEVYRNPNWGTICDSGWDVLDGNLVCEHLGFPGANNTYPGAFFGRGTGPVVLTDVACTENDTEFDNCTSNTSPGPECDHSRDASVRCSRPIRLSGGKNSLEGYVEVFDGHRWGPVCASHWTMSEARVVCNQIGELAAMEATSGMRFGRSTARYMMSRVQCSGTESVLDQCSFTTTGDQDCARFVPSTNPDPTLLSNTSNLAGVRCAPAVRLVGASQSSTFLEGQVEVYKNGEWGPVCANLWGREDAAVVCRQLGDYPLANSCCDASQTMVENPKMTNLECDGSEARLQDCRASQSEPPAQCLTATAKCQVTIRLTGGSHPLEGNVEIARNGNWGSICDDNWGLEDAQVVCRQLGNYEVVSFSCCSKYAIPQNSFLLDDVGCNGDEGRLEDCYHSDWGTHNCGTSEAAGVSCRNLRLVTDVLSTNSPRGRVELVHNGRWGRVCGVGWDMNAANVLCRQLYNSTAEGYNISSIPAGTGRGYLDNCRCTGTETSLMSCQCDQVDRDCGTSGDATVICKGGLRLVGGRTPLEGRVEIFHDGQWGTVCDDGWDLNDAQVVCRQLGNYAALSAKCCQAYGPGTGPILMDGVNCRGNEAVLENCPHEGWQTHNCQHYEDASVVCTDIKLTAKNGSSSTSALEGRVEILRDGDWKSVCAGGWDNTDAQIVCTQLFNTDIKEVKLFQHLEGQDTGLAKVNCRGNETMLANCPSQKENVVCPTPWRAGVQCKDYREADIRLVGGSRPSEGAVEVLVDGEWGLICGNDWGNSEGIVACRQLGYCTHVTTQRGWDPPLVAEERNVMHWHSMNCIGREDRLRDCNRSAGSFPCSAYNFEAAVVCKNWCEPPDTVLHGSVMPEQNEYPIGSKILFQCEQGYELKGTARQECMDICDWNAGEPRCIKSESGSGSGDKGDKGGPDKQTGHEEDGVPAVGVFFIGLLVGAVVVSIAFGVVWLIKYRSVSYTRGSPTRAGNIFRPRKPLDEMEEPVLSFQSMNTEHEENGDAL